MKALLVALLLFSGCAWQRNTEVLAAETRRAQVVAEIAQLSWLLKHSTKIERQIALEQVINERQAELGRLNAIVGGP